MTYADKATSRQILKEIREGTPDPDGKRAATIARADAAYASMARAEFKKRVRTWLHDCAHRAVQDAMHEMQLAFRVADDFQISHLNPSHLLYFIERLAEETL